MRSADFWQRRRVLVTGATGVLGSWLTLRLLALGADVVALVRDAVPHSLLVQQGGLAQVSVVHGDLNTPDLLARTFVEYEIDTCFHLAAITTVGIGNVSPALTFETNVRGTWQVLEAARRSPRTRAVVVASTDKVYSPAAVAPYSEDSAVAAGQPYGASKLAAEEIARSYAVTYGLPVAITRCANLFGGGDLNWNRIVPGTIRSVLHGETPVIRSDGTPQRDFIYLADAVEANLRLAEALDDPQMSGEVFNFGQDRPVSVLEMVNAIVRLADRPGLTPKVLGQVTGELQQQFMASARARDLLGWQPLYDFESALRETIAWYDAFFARKLA